MIILGLILVVAGFLLKFSILWTIGIILVIAGVIFAILGSTEGATTSNVTMANSTALKAAALERHSLTGLAPE
jgi:Zn-dependent membrane protease YugP